ncbi:MAG: Xaa-Pro dipeptidase [Steroidobacteraceae bacterium]
MQQNNNQLGALYAEHLGALQAQIAADLGHCGLRGLLLHAGSLQVAFQDDNYYPFRVNAPFKHWLPVLDAPDSFIYFEPGKRPQLLFHQPDDYWYKQAAIPDSYWVAHFDITVIRDPAEARAQLPADLSSVAFVGEPFDALVQWGDPAVNPPDLTLRMHYPRAMKSRYEIACLREANRMGAVAHRAAKQAFLAGGSEFDIHMAYLAACAQREQDLPYNSIIAENRNAAVLHYQILERDRPKHLHSLLIDAGAQVNGYACDITRTYSFSDREFAQLIEQFDLLQQSLCASVRSGSDWRDIHQSAHMLIAEWLQGADLISVEADEAVARGLSKVFYPHGIGHLLGLQVHDVGGTLRDRSGAEIPRPEGEGALRLTRVLEPGFVVTMEPGVYFIDSLLERARNSALAAAINWSRVEQLHPFGGIRIEDNLAVQQDGNENLTRDAFAKT